MRGISKTLEIDRTSYSCILIPSSLCPWRERRTIRKPIVQIRNSGVSPSMGIIAQMSEKPALKLFSWKKAIVIFTVGIGAISFRTYQSYQQKGHLDSLDIWIAAITIAIFLFVVAFVGWWANRQD